MREREDVESLESNELMGWFEKRYLGGHGQAGSHCGESVGADALRMPNGLTAESLLESDGVRFGMTD